MRDQAGVEEGRRAAIGLVDDLIDDYQIARLDLFPQRTDRAAGDHVRDAQCLERENIGAIWNL